MPVNHSGLNALAAAAEYLADPRLNVLADAAQGFAALPQPPVDLTLRLRDAGLRLPAGAAVLAGPDEYAPIEALIGALDPDNAPALLHRVITNGMNDEAFRRMILKRRRTVPEFIIRSIRA